MTEETEKEDFLTESQLQDITGGCLSCHVLQREAMSHILAGKAALDRAGELTRQGYHPDSQEVTSVIRKSSNSYENAAQHLQVVNAMGHGVGEPLSFEFPNGTRIRWDNIPRQP